MYKINNEEYYKKIYSPDTKQRIKIYLDGKEINTKYLKSLNLHDECFSDEYFSLGGTCYAQIDLTINKEAFIGIETFNEFYFEEIINLNEQKVTIPIGFFYAHPNDIDTSDDYTIKFTLYDKMYDLDEEGIDFSNLAKQRNFTRYDLVQFICEKYGMELATPNFINSSKLVGTYDSELSSRGWLSFVSERAGGFAKIGRDNKLYIKSYFGNIINKFKKLLFQLLQKEILKTAI